MRRWCNEQERVRREEGQEFFWSWNCQCWRSKVRLLLVRPALLMVVQILKRLRLSIEHQAGFAGIGIFNDGSE